MFHGPDPQAPATAFDIRCTDRPSNGQLVDASLVPQRLEGDRPRAWLESRADEDSGVKTDACDKHLGQHCNGRGPIREGRDAGPQS